MREFGIVGGYMENPEKPQNCQNWGGVGVGGGGGGRGRWVLAQVWALARDNTV